MDDDYVSLSFETNKHETFVNARNASLVPLLVAARRLPANVTLHVLDGAFCLRQREESIAAPCMGRVACVGPVGQTQKSTNRGRGKVKLADTCLQHHLKPLRQN